MHESQTHACRHAMKEQSSLKRCVCPSAYRSTELTTKSAFYPLPLSRQTAAFANNHWQGQAVDTARQLKLLLGG